MATNPVPSTPQVIRAAAQSAEQSSRLAATLAESLSWRQPHTVEELDELSETLGLALYHLGQVTAWIAAQRAAKQPPTVPGTPRHI